MENTDDDDPNKRRLKKAVSLTKKLQEKVSKELARRNEQLKKELESEHQKYKMLLAAFDNLFLEYKDVLHSNKDLSSKSILYDKWFDEKMEFLKTVRSEAGLERHIESNDIYHVVSGASLLRSSGTLDLGRSPLRVIGSPRAQSVDAVDLKSRSLDSRQPQVQEIHSSNDILSSYSEQNSILAEGIQGVLSAAADLRTIEATSPMGAIATPSPPVPLFEHFIVIGASIEAAKSISDGFKAKMSNTDRFMSMFRNNSKQASSVSTARQGGESVRRSSWVSGTSQTALSSQNAVPEVPPPHAASLAPISQESRRGSMFSRLMNWDSSTTDGNIGASEHSNASNVDSIGPKHDSWRPMLSTTTITTPSRTKENHTDASSPPVSAGSRPTDTSFVTPSLLYQYPVECNSTLSQMCDFCLPYGAPLTPLYPDSCESKIVDFLYGNYHDVRSTRCFVYMLEDKTLDLSTMSPDDETGIDTGRTYCICVMHPRWLNLEAGGVKSEVIPTQFETDVCYCFITRFPLFDFFFQVIWNMISYERIIRMESVVDLINDRSSYVYMPSTVYNTVMDSLSLVAPPHFGDILHFSFAPSVAPIVYTRSAPTGEYPEHFVNAAEWALPPLIHWLSPKILAWAIGLLMCEVKLIIIGSDPATVSCAVIGLTSLLKPLHWLYPIIPSVPGNLIEFLQSIPPIIAGTILGLVVNTKVANSMQPFDALHYAGDLDRACAVLDLNSKDIFMLKNHHEVARDFLFPGFHAFVADIKDDNRDMESRKGRIFKVSRGDVALVSDLLKLTSARLTTVAKRGVEFVKSKNRRLIDTRDCEEEFGSENCVDDVTEATSYSKSDSASESSDCAIGEERSVIEEDTVSLASLSVDTADENTGNRFMIRFSNTQMFSQFSSDNALNL